jgi:hypothetical protein
MYGENKMRIRFSSQYSSDVPVVTPEITHLRDLAIYKLRILIHHVVTQGSHAEWVETEQLMKHVSGSN